VSELTPALLWLIPGAPLIASLVIALFGKALLRGRSHIPCVAALAVSTAVAGFLNVMFLASPESLKPDSTLLTMKEFVAQHDDSKAITDANHGESHSAVKPQLAAPGFEWSVTDNLAVRVDVQVDAMTALMLLTVTFVSFLVSIYASGYMHGDPGYPRFFAAFALFVFSMSMLVLAKNYLTLFMFWEAVGLCSYLLIGFWFQRPSAAAAARKAFVVNRIGDFGFIMGIFLIWKTFGTVDFAEVFAKVPEVAKTDPTIFTTICLLLFVGAMGKSAQFPLHVWLPDAMEGPTPVSALIHAATMVTAGVYMVARSTPLFMHSPTAQMVVSGIGATTALLAALTALTQYDLKRVLAYSTVSQLGFMFMALGAASTSPKLATFAVTAAMFHLFTHAFFKALLFLGAGSVMHAMGDVIDMRRFSGLRHVMPHTHRTFLIGSLALAGCPLLAGFWSKDEILVALFEGTKAGGHETFFTVILAVAVVTAFLTAFYTFRAYNMTFLGEEKFPEEAHHPHESPPVMTVPLYVLAGFSVLIGLLLGPTGVYAHALGQSPVLEHGDHPHSAMLMGLSCVIFASAFGLARWMYVVAPSVPVQLESTLRPLHRLSLGKFFLDELFTYLIVKPVKVVALLCTLFDKYLIDGLLDFVGSLPATVGRLVRPIQNGFVSNYAWVMLLGFVMFLVQILRAWAG
jgi:NADH-quinone oxidoreductase subunit L